jgi:hypothetical protein
LSTENPTPKLQGRNRLLGGVPKIVMHPAFTARYTVLRKLGEGGQATVYQCRAREGDLTNGPVAPEVAVKVARES